MISVKLVKQFYLSEVDLIDIDILIAFVIKKPREFILTHPEFELNRQQFNKLKNLIKRRKKGDPIAYLVGQKEFYGFNFFVNKNVLVPRPETELIVEEVLKIINPNLETQIIDVGTGSGCIIISVAIEFKKKHGNVGGVKFFAVDISPEALKVARKNANVFNLGNRIKFLKGDLLSSLKFSGQGRRQLVFQKSEIIKNDIIIIANLPYLTPRQIKESPSIQAEPRLALEAGHDGLKYYRLILAQIKRKKLFSAKILFEIDPSQVQGIKKIIFNYLPKAKIEIIKDLAGFDRVVKLKFN